MIFSRVFVCASVLPYKKGQFSVPYSPPEEATPPPPPPPVVVQVQEPQPPYFLDSSVEVDPPETAAHLADRRSSSGSSQSSKSSKSSGSNPNGNELGGMEGAFADKAVS